MQLKYSKNISPAVDGMQKISAMTWAPNGKKFSVCTSDRVVHLFDEQGEKKDKFPTKPSEKGQKTYVVRSLEFSPDSQKVAVAQSDNIIYIYRVGTDWGEKKTICNKFPASSSVTCLSWPKDKANEIYFGLAEGKIKCGILRSNKSATLFNNESYVVSIAASRDGNSLVSGHLDNVIYLHNLESQTSTKVVTHHSIPYALGWGEHIVAAGNDAKVSFYDKNGNLFQRFDYTNDPKIRDFSAIAVNLTGDNVVLGNFNRIYIYNYNSRRSLWEELGIKDIENYYTVTAACWKNDGSKLVIGSLCGSIDLFDASMKKIKYKGKFELNYVSPSQIIVHTLSTGNKAVVKSENSLEIYKINIHQDRYVVANTNDTLIVGDIEVNITSEISWRGSGNEKYDFSNPGICMVFNAGELSIIEYGNNDILGTCRTEYMSTHYISARIGQQRDPNKKVDKVIAYLLDLQTIQIQDLNNSSIIGSITHDTKIDFLELNANANKLLFRDKRRNLFLFNIKTQSKYTLLNYCNYAQWVPDSEVAVAQNRNNLCVWYSIDNPDKVTFYSIKGEVVQIERNNGKTEVIVSDNSNSIAYTLDEALIQFGFAIECQDLERAVKILDAQELNPETEAMWKSLAQAALEQQNIIVAERCYAALGDVAKARFLRKSIKLMKQYQQETGKSNGLDFYKVQARQAMLDKQFYRAEAILLDHNEVEEAMEMYQELHKWDQSIKIAEKKNHPDAKELKTNYLQWLLDTNQEDKAAEMKENEGDYVTAINLYLKGGLPAKAAQVIMNYHIESNELNEKVATALTHYHMYEKAGEFYEMMGLLQKSLESYVKGGAYKKAVELARKAAPALVVTLEEKWGDYLVQQKQTENAINHYIEANQFQKAIEAAINSRQWNKAVQLVQNQQPEIARPFYKQIARHFAELKQYDLAEKYYVKANQTTEAFEMYIKAGKYENALKVVKNNMPENEIALLHVKQAQKFEEQQLYKDAEKLYLAVDEPDLAINMYKKIGQYENMIRLVGKYRKNLLKDTHLSIAQKLEKEGNLRQAEHHYVESGAWHGAVEMYKNQNMWEEAIRVCKTNGSDKETSELAKKWAETLGPDAGMKMLLKMNLVDAVIEYQMDRNEFEEALRMAQQNAKHKIYDVHLRYALYLEDERRFKEAEEEFVKAGKPGEAISMYEHQGDWHSALGVARQYEPNSVPSILISQGKSLMEKRDYVKAEACFINARKPEIAIKMYLDLSNYQEALRVAKKHAPHLVNEINNRYLNKAGGNMSGEELLESAKLWEESRDWSRAIDTYLEIKKEHFNDLNILQEAWERAVHISMSHDKERCQEVITIVCKRLKDIRRFEPAAEFYETIGMYEDAVQCYIAGGQYDKARVSANQIRNPELLNKLNDIIDKSYKNHLKNGGQAEELVVQGNVTEGLDMLSERGDWTQCFELAQKQGKEILNKYLLKHSKVTIKAGNYKAAIEAFANYGFPFIPQNYPLYKTLSLEIFAGNDAQEIFYLRKALYGLYQNLKSSNELNTNIGIEFNKYTTIAHLTNLKNIVAKKGTTPKIHMKLCVSLLKYCDVIRIDQLYYEAGSIARKNNSLSLAFVMLNRYLDIYEAIQDPDSNNLGDNTDFEMTDIPSPYDVNVPEQNYIEEKEKEEIRDWLLQISISQKIDQSLPTRQCEKCGTKIFDGCLCCPKCKTTWDSCIITGYPLLKSNHTNCKSCGKGGLKEHWTEYLAQYANCPWCNNVPN